MGWGQFQLGFGAAGDKFCHRFWDLIANHQVCLDITSLCSQKKHQTLMFVLVRKPITGICFVMACTGEKYGGHATAGICKNGSKWVGVTHSA